MDYLSIIVDMISVIQRVNEVKVTIDNKPYSEIKNGYLILLGIFQEDNEKDADKLVEKIINFYRKIKE